MRKLRSNWDTRGTSDNGGETAVEPGRWSRGGGLGEGGEEGQSMKGSLPSTLCTYVRIPMSTSTSCMGKGDEEGAGGRPAKCRVHACHYHCELHYDVRLQCTNKST